MTKDKPNDLPPMRRVADVAAALDVSEKTVRRLIASGDLPNYRLGRTVRVSDEDIQLFLKRRRS
jgi:excisionase family DNA binding protein